MRHRNCSVIALSLVIFGFSAPASAQGRGGHSTVQGDILSGAGSFLRGAAWYEVGSAQARSIDANTAMRVADWNKRVYDNYKREISNHYAKEVRTSNAIQRKAIERQVKLRLEPTLNQVRSGEALNALMLDLSDPTISESGWRGSQVELAPELSIRELVFRLITNSGDRAAIAMSKGVIALARLDQEHRWPTPLRAEELAAERTSYEQSYRQVREKCLKDSLDLPTVTRLDGAIERLKNKVDVVVPVDRGFRKEAKAHVVEMAKATVMFDASLIDYAQEMIRDTQDHDARTVGQLLAFMRKYRLIFADSGGNPNVAELYSKLILLLREQKEALGLKTEVPDQADRPPADSEPPAAKAANPRNASGRWFHTVVNGKQHDEQFLNPDGSVTRRGVVAGSWSQHGSRLVFRWPSKNAPGGAWVDSVTVSQDGANYEGKNQKGAIVRGKRDL